MISALPDIKKLIVSPEDEFMVLACDGIWNFMTSEEVVEFVRLRLKDENKKMSEICEELFDACLAPNTLGDGTGCDNMTAVIVRFKPSILGLSTKIDPNETEDVLLLAKQNEDEPEQKAQKRSASPTSDDSNEAENKTKRLKTDNKKDDDNTTTLTSSSIESTTTATTSKTAAPEGSNAATSPSTGADSNDAKMNEDASSAVVSST